MQRRLGNVNGRVWHGATGTRTEGEITLNQHINITAGFVVMGSDNTTSISQADCPLSIEANTKNADDLTRPHGPELQSVNRKRKSDTGEDRTAFQEYATSGKVSRDTGRIRDIVKELSAAEELVKRGNMSQALAVLDAASSSLSAAHLGPEYVSNLAENQPSPIRACILYFCAAKFVQPGNPGISGYVLKLGKMLGTGKENVNLGKKFGIPLMELISEGIQGSDTVGKAYAQNWIAFSCNEFGEYSKAVKYAECGIRAMDETFGRNAAPRRQVYCRLLLSAGDATRNLGKHKQAATYYKRASLTLGMANDFKPNQKLVLMKKINECGRIYNQAFGH